MRVEAAARDQHPTPLFLAPRRSPDIIVSGVPMHRLRCRESVNCSESTRCKTCERSLTRCSFARLSLCSAGLHAAGQMTRRFNPLLCLAARIGGDERTSRVKRRSARSGTQQHAGGKHKQKQQQSRAEQSSSERRGSKEQKVEPLFASHDT